MPAITPRLESAQETDWTTLIRIRRAGLIPVELSPHQVIEDWQAEHLRFHILWTCIRVEESFNFSGVEKRFIRIKIFYRIK